MYAGREWVVGEVYVTTEDMAVPGVPISLAKGTVVSVIILDDDNEPRFRWIGDGDERAGGWYLGSSGAALLEPIPLPDLHDRPALEAWLNEGSS